jgi:PAS domain S-box-containing protein
MISLLCVGDGKGPLSRYIQILSQSPNISLDFSLTFHEALAKLKSASYDGVLAAYHLPEMNGIDLLHHVRELFGDLPFILYIGAEKEDIANDALSYGADLCLTDYIDIRFERTRLIHVINRIVEGRETKQALQKSIAQLYHAEYIAGLGHWTYDPDSGIISASLGAQAIIGCNTEKITIDDLLNVLLIKDRSRFNASLQDFILRKRTLNEECKIRRPTDNALVDVHFIAEYDPASHTVFGIIQDITGRKKIERALRLSESKFRMLVENINDVIFSVNPKGQIAYFSPAGERLFGYRPADLAGRFFLDMVYEEDRPAILKRFEEMEKGVLKPLEWRLIKKDGSLSWVRTSTRPVTDTGGNLKYFGVITDITREKEAYAALIESEEKYRSLVSYSLEGIVILNFEGKLLFANMAALHLVGVSDQALLSGVNVMDFIAPESRDQVLQDLSRVREGIDPFIAEYQICTIHGEKIWVECVGKLIRYEGQDADLLSIRDVSDRKAAEEELKASEERYRSFVEYAYDIVYSLTPDGVFTYISPNWADVLGHNTQEIIGSSYTNIVHPDDIGATSQFLETIISTGQKMGGVEYRVRHKDGSWKWHVSSVTLVRNPDGTPKAFLGIAHDITERKKSEEALFQANRQLNLLSSITRHDILNQINAIFIYLDAMKAMAHDQRIDEFIDNIMACTGKIQSHIEFTKTYEGLGLHEPEWQALIHCIQETHLPESIRIILNLPDVYLYADQMLSRVFLNLIDNSIRHGKTVTSIHISAQRSGDEFLITYADDGVGIPLEYKEKIFERGFGNNTGLGLFLVREILALTGISIAERGREGQGAVFEIRVPKGGWRAAM